MKIYNYYIFMNKNIFKKIKSNSILYKMENIFNELEELQKLKKLRDFKPFYELYNNTFDNKVKWFDFIKKENRIKNIINLSVKLGEYTKEQGNLIYQIFKNEELVKRDKKETNKLKRLKNKYYFESYKNYINSKILYKDFNKKKGKQARIKEIEEVFESEKEIKSYVTNEINFLRSKAGINFRTYENKLDLSTKEFDFIENSNSDIMNYYRDRIINRYYNKNKIQIIKIKYKYRQIEEQDWKFAIDTFSTDKENFKLEELKRILYRNFEKSETDKIYKYILIL